MSRGALQAALAELLAAEARDHALVAASVRDAVGSAQPADPDLAALAAALRRLRWLDGDATALSLLAEASSQHPDAVERHLAWLAHRSAGPHLVDLVRGGSGRALAAAC